MRTRIAGFSARISRVASMPEPSGRRISMMTRSGRCVRAASIASAAVPTWATTVKAGRRSSSATSPSRTTSWSSTTRSRRTEGGFVSIKGGTCRDGSSDRGADRGPAPSYALHDVTPPSVLRLLVVDDHEVVREGLAALLDRRAAFTVVAQVGTAAEAIEAARTHRPDLVIMDIRLPDGSGIEATREIRAENPAIRVLMLTSYPDEEAVFAAIVAGASGYLLKQI